MSTNKGKREYMWLTHFSATHILKSEEVSNISSLLQMPDVTHQLKKMCVKAEFQRSFKAKLRHQTV